MKRMPAPKNQWTISARGSIPRLEIGDQRPGDEDREQEPDRDHEQWRLRDEPPEALAARMEQRHAVGLHDRPDDAGGARGRADERQDLDPCVAATDFRRRI